MRKFLYIIFSFVFFNSCEDMSLTIDLDLPPHDSQLVVNSFLEVGDTFSKVYITHSIDPISVNQFAQIDDATVLLKKNNIIVDELLYQEDPDSWSNFSFCYLTDVVIEENSSYQLEVTHPNYPKATAQEIIPSPIAIQSLLLGEIQDYQQSLNFTINDPAGVDNYYLLRIKYKGKDMYSGKLSAEWNSLDFESNEPAFEGNEAWYEEYDGRKVLFNDHLFNGTNKTFYIDLVYPTYGTYEYEQQQNFQSLEIDSIKVILYSVSEAYYNYHKSRRLQNQNNNDISEFLGAEPVVVYNNIKNGFGIFASKSKFESVIYIY